MLLTPTKRIIDIVIAGIACIFLALPSAVVAFAVGLTSPGGVIYKHPRVGVDGKYFNLYKFRSMSHNARTIDPSSPFAKVVNDDRVTTVGKFIRKWSIDEIPQLINVLAGHMSIVGPRPQVAAEVAFYPEVARERLSVRPGITGLWQVSGRSDLDWQEGLELDLRYVRTHGIVTDLHIMYRTVGAVLNKTGAY